jgi:predicted KAP-like P-loop ATPase
MTDTSETLRQRHPFSADRPIASRVEDRLGRAPFAAAVADALRGWKGRESIVVGVYGDWGVGKTSLKNLVLEDLRSTEACPEILELNPWEYEESNLQRAFLDELGRAIGRKDRSKRARELAKRIRSYAAVISVGEKITAGLPATLSLLLKIIGLLGFGSAILGAAQSQPVTATVGVVVTAISGLLGSSRRFAQWLAERASRRAEETHKSASELKKEISGLLQERERPVLVVMDDVDRMEAAEVRRLFRLVKVNADFPNVVYLLLFQRDVVERALEHDGAQPGRKFLEKIVQVSFNVPRPLPEEVHQILFDGLNRILELRLKERRFDKTRWTNMFVPGLSGYFDTLRSVHRFLSTFEFHLGFLSRAGTLEVDSVDFIALETLRLFEPEVYSVLQRSKDLFTKADPYGRDDSTPRKEAVLRIVNCADESHRPRVGEILRRLFPTIDWVFGGARYGGTSEQWERDLRVCTDEFFDRYFRLDISARDLSQADLLPLLSTAASRAELIDHLRSLDKRGLLPLALNRLEAHKEKRGHANAAAFVTAIFDIGELLPEQGLAFSIDPTTHASRIVLWFLKSESDGSLRTRVLEQAIKETTGLVLPVRQIALEEPQEGERANPIEGLLQKEDLPRFRALCIEKIETAARNGTLLENPHLLYILFRWKFWGGLQAAREWAVATMTEPTMAITLLQRFVQVAATRGMEDYAVRTHPYINLSQLETFVDLDPLKEALASVDLEALSEEGSRALRCFARALQHRAEGKPDEPHGFPRDEEWD